MMHADKHRFQGGLVFKAHSLLHHSTLGLRAIKKKKKTNLDGVVAALLSRPLRNGERILSLSLSHTLPIPLSLPPSIPEP